MATNQEAMCTGEPPSKGHQELRHQNKHIMRFESGWEQRGEWVQLWAQVRDSSSDNSQNSPGEDSYGQNSAETYNADT